MNTNSNVTEKEERKIGKSKGRESRTNIEGERKKRKKEKNEEK